MSGGMSMTNRYSTIQEVVGSSTAEIGESRSLTNIQTQSDAWGKVIPYTWGLSRVGGALIWSSGFYKTIRKFRTTTQYKNTQYDNVWTNNPGVVTGTEQTVTESEQTEYFIDLCYSLGYEGDTRVTRTPTRVRINDVVVYDVETGYIMPGLGFSIRPGNDLSIPSVMAEYETGIYYYPGQTLIVFDRFPLAQFGNSVPSRVDVEFGLSGIGDQFTTTEYEPTAPDTLHNERVFVNHDAGRFYQLNNANTHFQVYDYVTGERLDDLELKGTGLAAFQAAGGPDVSWNVQIIMSGALNVGLCVPSGGLNTDGLFTIDFDSGFVTNVSAGAPHQIGLRLYNETANSAVFVGWQFFGSGNIINFHTITKNPDGSCARVTTTEAAPRNGNPSFHADGAGNLVAVWSDGDLRFRPAGKAWRQFPAIPGGQYNSAVTHGGLVAAVIDFGSSKNPIRGYDENGVQTWEFIYATVPTSGDLYYIDGATNGLDNTVNSQGDVASGYMGMQATVPGLYLVVDIVTGQAREFVRSAALPGRYFWDSRLKLFVYARVTGNPMEGGSIEWGTFGPGGGGTRVPLFAFLQSLYADTEKYTFNQITNDGVNDTIRGAIISAQTDVNSFVNDVSFLYRFEKDEDSSGIHFFRNRSATNVDVSAYLDAGDLVASTDPNIDPLRVVRVSGNALPATVTFKFLDVDNQYKENTVQWRRPDALDGDSSQRNIALPFVMSVQEATGLVQTAVADSRAKTTEFEFILPAEYRYLGEGDIIEVTNGKFVETIRITEATYNANFTVSCRGEGVKLAIRVEPPPVELPPRDVGNTGTASTVPSILYVLDTPTLSIEDDPATGDPVEYFAVGPQRAGNWQGAYLARLPDDGNAWETMFHVYGPQKLIVFKATNALANRRWVTDPDQLEVTKLSGTYSTANNKTKAEIDADRKLNLAWYGAAGRWEIVQFESIVGGKISGIVRGLRGTEINAGKHAVDDLFVIPTYGVTRAVRPLADVGDVERFKAVSEAELFASVPQGAPETFTGASLRPFAPSSLQATRDGSGDVLLTWSRRDRLGDGWGSPLPLSEAAESYRVRILAPDGISAYRTIETTEASATYTAADQATDGLASASVLIASVAQIGATGEGFSEARSVNVGQS